MGGLLIIYTMTGGAKAVAYTQQLQLIIIFIGMFLAAYMVVNMLPKGIGFMDALHVSGKMHKLNVITSGFKKQGGFDWSDQYNIFSGLIGGFFLALSYFGTDQSQVGRYLTASSIKESRLGLLINGIVKIPMQFLILLVGALVFTFYLFNRAPVFFNQTQLSKIKTEYKDSLHLLEQEHEALNLLKQKKVYDFSIAYQQNNDVVAEKNAMELRALQQYSDSLRGKVKQWIRKSDGDDNDTNYIFFRFVVDFLPVGLVGLLTAIIFLASWGSIAAALNSLSSSTMIDFHRRFSKNEISPEQEYKFSKWWTLAWGIFCIIVAMFTYNIGNSLIEAVNVLGSLFYGVVLGVFFVAFFFKKIKNGSAVFVGAVLAELLVLTIFALIKSKYIKLGFLWLNPIGVSAVIFFTLVLNSVLPRKNLG
jgi:Na+/proline symporter